jgi:hypothetical protein
MMEIYNFDHESYIIKLYQDSPEKELILDGTPMQYLQSWIEFDAWKLIVRQCMRNCTIRMACMHCVLQRIRTLLHSRSDVGSTCRDEMLLILDVRHEEWVEDQPLPDHDSE